MPRKRVDTVRDEAAYKKVLEILDAEGGLSEWEVGFAEKIVEEIEAGHLMTPKQNAKLDEILGELDGVEERDRDQTQQMEED